MGSGASKGGEMVEDPAYAQRSTAAMSGQQVESQAGFSEGPPSKSQASFYPQSRSRAHMSRPGMSSIAEGRHSRVEGYDVHVVQITKDGFSTSDVTIMEGQLVTFVWDDSCSPNMTLMQVVYDGETLRPVVGGYSAAPNDCRGEFEQLFNLEGEYKFAINKIRCTPFIVNVKRRADLHADVADDGFNPRIICIDQGHAVRWTWKACNTPHTVNEIFYVMERGCFKRQHGKNQNLVATVSGTHRQQFNRPGLYYFRTESSELGKTHLCIVCVREAPREYKVDILDRTFSPMILLIQEGDRVWWSWDKNKCKKQHHIYQIDAPALDHKDDAPYEPTPEGFKWHQNPSHQGLMSHVFRHPGVYYFSDQNYDEAAEYMGTIIVKPKPKEHQVELKGKGFNPDVVYANTGDRIWWTWDGDAVADVKETLLILEEDKVLNPVSRKQEEPEDENLLQGMNSDALQLMTRSGLASVNFTTIGVYTYKISDVADNFDSCSVIVNPGPKNHTIHLTDTGFEPKVVTIRPNDRVWWVWQSGKKQHNIIQVSHQGIPIKEGFCSGLPRDSPSAFHHQFLSPGVFYFISKSLPKIFGAIVVATQPQVHEVTVGPEIQPDPVTMQLNDIVCWVFKQAVSQGISVVETVDQILDAQNANVPVVARRCIGKAVTQLGIQHYHSRSFQKAGKHKSVTAEVRMSSSVCDERCDYFVIKLNKRGFHPKTMYLLRGQSVMWTWKGSDEDHNIIHVTDPDSDAPMNVIQGPRSFNSGKLIANNSFLYTFDEPGSYAVASQGAPGFSCVVHILEEAARSSEPYITSEKTGGTMERYTRIDLATKTAGAEIYYTTDGSLPALHHDATKHYHTDKGIHLRESGLCFVRAIAVKPGQLQSHPFTSRRFWVLSEGDNEVSMDDNSNSQEVEAKETTSWDWWGCRPHIRGCFTGPGILEVFWEVPSNEAARSQIKGYQVFLNGISYCDMFPPSNNSLNIAGLAGGTTYKIYVEVYPKDKKNVVQESNSLNLECPTENANGGPIISLVKTDKTDSLAIVWMSVDKPEVPIDGYLIFLNDQQCGPKLVPDPDSNRCKVVIGSCELNADYKIYVQALIANSTDKRMSNVLEVRLPLDVSRFRYPPVKERLDEKDLYLEYIEIAEGSGYLASMDAPDNPIWETETDTTSGEEEEDDRRKSKKKRRTNVSSLDKSQAKQQETNEVQRRAPSALPGGSNFFTKTTPREVEAPVAQAKLQESSDSEADSDVGTGRAGKHAVILDASRNQTTDTKQSQVSYERQDFEEEKAERVALLGSARDTDDTGGHSQPLQGSGMAIIEVQKTVALDKTGREMKATGDIAEKTKLAVSTEKTTMMRVGEGEVIPGDSDGLLPAPSIMVMSQGRHSVQVNWELTDKIGPQYKPLMFVVNAVGTKFDSSINSDISFECNLVEKGKQVRGVQHCWNVQNGQQCLINGLHSGNTYRIYVIANYSMIQGKKPCEIQTTSAVLYYTTMGPPKSPVLRVMRVDAYQACLEWEEPVMENGMKLKGYQIYVDRKPLGGRRSPDIRQMVINNLVPGKTLSVYVVAVSEFADQESEPSQTLHISCPLRPPAPSISQQPSYKRGCVLMAWNKPTGHTYSSNDEAVTFYSIFIDGKWHGEVKANKMSDSQGYQFFLTDLSPEQSYDVSVKTVAGERRIDPQSQHIYCLSESPMSNIVPVMAPAAPKSPKLRLEGLHPDGIDVTWQVPQQCGDAYISGYQMLKNGKLYGSIIPPDVNSLRIRDVTLGEKIELQLIALTEHPVGKSDRKSTDGDKDSGIGGSSHPEDRVTASPVSHRSPRAKPRLITFTKEISSRDCPQALQDVFTGERYAGCKPGPKLVVHYTGLVCAPTEVWCEKATGHSALVVWKKLDESKAHYLRPDSYQVTWWPGDRPQEEIQSDSTTEDHLLITGLRPSISYTIVVEARKMEKYTDMDEGASSARETPDGLNAFILSSKSEQLLVKTASPPEPPTNVGVVAMTCHSLKVGWDPPREHGSEIIAIRVECISLDPQNSHHIAVDTLPDATIADVNGLHEKTDYLLKVIAVTEEYFDRLPEKHRHKRLRGFPQDVMASQEESPWLPHSSILIKTSGTESPTNIRVMKATTTSLTLTWTPPLVHGSNKLTGQIVRWSDVKKSRRADHEDLQIASHVNLLPTEDTLTIEDLVPGAQYKVVIEAVVSVKTSLDLDKWDGNNIEKFRRTAHVMSKPFFTRTRAPIEPPKVQVTSYTQMSATLYWEKPPLMSVVGKDEEDNPKYLRRYLQGYKLEINGKLQCCLGPDSNSCTLTKCKPGRTYNVVLVAMTCTDEGKKARKQKYKSYFKSMETKEVDYMALLQDDDNLDESPSEPLEVILPKDQEGFLKTLEAKFLPQMERDNKTFGDIELAWTVQGKTNLLKQFNIIWYSIDDRVIQTKYVGPEQRRCTIPVTRIKTVYHMKVEPGYYTDVLPQPSQEVQVMIPGPPDAPEIFLRSLDVDEFCIEWGEPRLFGGVKIKGYQVFLNDKKAGNELNANHNKATIPCRPNRTYRVNVVALSDKPDYGDSARSNTLVVNPSGQGDTTPHQDDWVVDDAGIPVKVSKVTENGIHLDWSRFVETDDVSFYKIQWSSVAQPEQREVRLSEKDSNCVINKCLPGTTHFVRIVAFNANGQILEKSKQLTVQTSAPPDAPKLSVRACNFRYVAIQWDKPTTYGDALVTGYKVYVNGIVEAVLNADQLNYTYTQGKWCHEYAFQVQALTPGDLLNSKPSEPLVVTWPGSKAPAIKRLPSVSSSTLRVGWDEPYLTEGLKVKHYKLCCVEEDTEKLVQSVGPIHPDSREAEFKNLKKGNYSVYLEIYLYGTDTVIRSEVMRMQPALSPDPPQTTVTLVGLEERRQIEKFTCDLVNKRDRLIRQVGHKLKRIGALSHPLRAEKNEDVVFSAHSLTRIEELLEDCFNALENYTGQLTAHVSWQCPQSNPDIQLSGYKVLVDGKQYGSPMHSGVRTVKIQLGLEQPSYRLTMVATSEKPQGSSAESNTVEILSMPFKPFSFYCYNAIHSKDSKYPAYGCCKYQDSISYERQVAKKLANQGLLHKQVPPPSCSLLDIFDGEYKPLMSCHSARVPTVILFWTPWCLSSQKIMDFYIRFARDNTKEMTFMAVTCGVSGTSADSRKNLAHTITSNSWREDKVVWHVTSECASNVYETMNSINRYNSGQKFEAESVREKYMDLTEVLGIAGVPTFLFIHPDGHIAWHGRYCAFDYAAFDAFMRCTKSEVVRQPCPVFNCDLCKSDTTVDEDAMTLQMPHLSSSQTRSAATRAASPDSMDMGSRPDMKYAALSGYTDNVTGTERVFVSPKARPKSPKVRRKRSNISVNKRPYSASGASAALDRSPYLACVAPHIHQPHTVKTRPASAKKLIHYV
ncbi:uncharacterized protein LOC101845075 isoform X2 [Aplysia californica]|uniref:Uncharacterized protein LOC101845075 isoform X2 n=1 Tax=Aplysia californica TaxID=6500 RepID=A0ABM0ZVI2_APLCA|nr:uncharacterized protein LOC101845075 isoform X2 [Aplysia californica]